MLPGRSTSSPRSSKLRSFQRLLCSRPGSAGTPIHGVGSYTRLGCMPYQIQIRGNCHPSTRLRMASMWMAATTLRYHLRAPHSMKLLCRPVQKVLGRICFPCVNMQLGQSLVRLSAPQRGKSDYAAGRSRPCIRSMCRRFGAISNIGSRTFCSIARFTRRSSLSHTLLPYSAV